VHCDFVWCNVRSFYYFSWTFNASWRSSMKDREQIAYKLLYSSMCLYWANADLSTALKMLSIRWEVNGANASHCAPISFSTRAVTILLFRILLVYHCALYLWNVNFTTCSWTLLYHTWTTTTNKAYCSLV